MDDLVKSYLAGESINKLMQRFYLSRKVIAGRLRKSGVKLRSRTESANLTLTKTIPRFDAVIERYIAGESIVALAADLGVCDKTIRLKLSRVESPSAIWPKASFLRCPN